MACLDDATVLAFCRGGLAPSARAVAEEHLAGCDECRSLVAVVARSSIVDEARAGDDAASSLLGNHGNRNGATARDARRSAGVNAVITPLGLGPEPLADPMAPTTPVDAGRRPSSLAPALSIQPGQIIAGKYEVERVLGAGGMGVVVAARHRHLHQRVALKFLQPAVCEVLGTAARFLREGQAAAQITSEHVARVIDTGALDDGPPYLVLEYLEGSDLGALIDARGKLTVDEATEYVLQAGEAIAEAHALGIVHRDLKPANLFLARRADGSPLVKVLDFGISKIEESASRPALTGTSALMGSPRYMSPEQMLSAKDVDARADVWALGVILFELVTGRPVWTADTIQGLCALVATEPAPRLRDLVPEAPPALDAVVADCLVKAREERIPSVAELARRLHPIAPERARVSIERIVRLSGQTLGEAASRALPSTERTARAKPRLLAALFTLAALAGGYGFYATRAADPESAPRALDDEASSVVLAPSAPSAPSLAVAPTKDVPEPLVLPVAIASPGEVIVRTQDDASTRPSTNLSPGATPAPTPAPPRATSPSRRKGGPGTAPATTAQAPRDRALLDRK